MKAGVLLFVIADLKEYLVSSQNLNNDGSFNSLDLQEDIQIVKVVENSLKVHGVTIQSEVDKVINALPLLLTLIK